MTAIEIRPATVADAELLALCLHPDDYAEVLALGQDPRAALIQSVEMSASGEAWAGLADGELVCLFGVVPLSLVGVTAVPWLLGSPLVQMHGRTFLRLNKQFIERWRRDYPVLRNVVHARHRRAVRWLQWLGFTLGEPVSMEPHGAPFHPFVMETP